MENYSGPTRYALFVGERYYPGKWSDFIDYFDSIDEALIKTRSTKYDDNDDYWYQVVDLKTAKVVADSYWEDELIEAAKFKADYGFMLGNADRVLKKFYKLTGTEGE